MSPDQAVERSLHGTRFGGAHRPVSSRKFKEVVK